MDDDRAAVLHLLNGAVVWLAPKACLWQSHLPPPQGSAPVVVQVVGVADSTDWPGWVLMLD